MVKVDPETPDWWVEWAYATRKNTTLEEAESILSQAEHMHPQNASITFNLACCQCLLGKFLEAKARVKKAIELDAAFKLASLEHPDLDGLWANL